MLLIRVPAPALRPFVKTLWALDQTDSPLLVGADREHVLPTGAMHLVFRLSNHPLCLFESAYANVGQNIGHDIVGGARSTYYVRDVSESVRSVGVQFQPGGADLLLGVPADELAGRHTPLGDLWGRFASEARERLLEAGGPDQRLDLLESILTMRLPRVRGMHPAVAQALERFTMTTNVREVVTEYGYSHRRFIELFRRAVGLTPKLYCRVLRFQAVLDRIAADPGLSLVELALAAGYSDQSHFNREFREFAGLAPVEYRTATPSFGNHVPISRRLR
ncbi:MAG: helix-turn-helix domain-containing protein [Acidobacteriota bacterium]